MLITNHLRQYHKAIRLLPRDSGLTKQDLLIPDFLISSSGNVETYYAPHNEYVNPCAKVVIIGLTPGFTQMRVALEEAKKCLEEGLSDEDVCRRAKMEASFAGSLRVNLIHMLDSLDLPRYLNIPSCAALFGEYRVLLHTSSLLRFPVFVDQANYNGSRPGLLRTASLRESALNFMEEELRELENRTLLIPLGKTVESVLKLLVQEDKLDEGQCLWGFPHPSGANGHRHQQFASRKEEMRMRIQAYFSHLSSL